MKVGFIGAGKVGFSMGKYLTERGVKVTGYFSRSPGSSEEAAEFTNTNQYLTVKELVKDSDALFLTVPDSAIAAVWQTLKGIPLRNKIICHFSGALSSGIFSDSASLHASGYSIHPLFAFNDRYHSYKGLSNAFFTIEGSSDRLPEVEQLLRQLGNSYAVISSADKVRYHCAAATVSNLYVGLAAMGEKMLVSCGFSEESAHRALAPLMENNARNIAEKGPVNALTGPIERNDTATVLAHLNCLEGDQKQIYRLLSREVLKTAAVRHPDFDYTEMEKILS